MIGAFNSERLKYPGACTSIRLADTFDTVFYSFILQYHSYFKGGWGSFYMFGILAALF